jgi:N-acetylglucosaminyldiphosphoundecaprenol N-acetyl-beta-D-mannosaminyltransferase
LSAWPAKLSLFGVRISATDYDQAEALVLEAAQRRQGAIVTHLAVHGLMTAARDEHYRSRINAFDIVAPDGQPVRWALNHFHGAALRQRCYGPELMLRLCRRAAEKGVAIYLYGSTPEVMRSLAANLLARFPALRIVGTETPPFGSLSAEESAAAVGRINDSGAGMVFIGLGCPRQDLFAFEHRGTVRAVQVCVGAAFDFHAATKRMAPAWMQRCGLEWLFRLTQEPFRLWRRYAVNNTLFLFYVTRQLLRFSPPSA